MIATYFGCPVIGIESLTPSTATIVVEIPECPGPERIENVPLSDIDVWPSRISRPGHPPARAASGRATAAHADSHSAPSGPVATPPVVIGPDPEGVDAMRAMLAGSLISTVLWVAGAIILWRLCS